MSALGGDSDGQLAELTEDLDRLVRRLRGLSRLAWRSRRSVVEDLLRDMEHLTAHLEGRPVKRIPSIADHALGDAVAVIGGDALSAKRQTRDFSMLEGLTGRIRRALDATH